MSEENACKQSVVLNDRREIRVNGISSVDSFDENRICGVCHDGTRVIVEGANLSIKQVNLEECYFEANGEILGFFYEAGRIKKDSGFFKRFFGER